MTTKKGFQSTLPVWGATTVFNMHRACRIISIHAPRVGSDWALMERKMREVLISIHAPRVGSDSSWMTSMVTPQDFNPRSPCGERLCICSHRQVDKRISIHAPRVGSDIIAVVERGRTDNISIHAPRVGSDDNTTSLIAPFTGFQSTLPVWGATRSVC